MPLAFSDEFPVRITHARAMHGLSHKELADEVGITPDQLQKYESGESVPRIAVLLRLAKRLRLDPIWLSGDTREVDIDALQREADDFEAIPEGIIATPVHLGSELRTLVAKAARDNGRTVHDEIVERLASTFDRSTRFYAELLRSLANELEGRGE